MSRTRRDRDAEPHRRAGDTDRAAVATVLGRHMAEGRLTVAEYDDRVARRTAVIVASIWAISSVVAVRFIYFWPIRVVGPWGAMLLAHTVGGGHRPRSRRHT